jgi:hypothetical protein
MIGYDNNVAHVSTIKLKQKKIEILMYIYYERLKRTSYFDYKTKYHNINYLSFD